MPWGTTTYTSGYPGGNAAGQGGLYMNPGDVFFVTAGTDATGTTLTGEKLDKYVEAKIKATVDARAAEYARLDAIYSGFGDHYLPKLGTAFEINDKRAQVVALCHDNRSFLAQPYVFTTYDRALQYAKPQRYGREQQKAAAQNAPHVRQPPLATTTESSG